MGVAAPARTAERGAVAAGGAPRRRRPSAPVAGLALAFAVTAAYLCLQAVRVDSYVWLVDELLYLRYAESYSALQGPLPHVHGEPYGVPNALYPLLLAPLFWVFDGLPAAFHAAHVVNGLVWASTLVPVFVLVRRLGARWPWALGAAVLSVWVPWSVATLAVMTESLTYPLVAWSVLAMTVAVADPRPRHDVLALVAIVATTLTRTQLVFLLPVFVLAIVVHELGLRDGPPWRERLRAHRAIGAVVAAGVAGLAAVQLAGIDLLGGYGVVTTLAPFPPGLWPSMLDHAVRVTVGLGILPVVLWLTWLARVALDPRSAFERAHAVVATLTLGVLLFQAGNFAVNVAAVVQERYVAYAAPVLVAGAAALLADRSGRPAPRLSLLAATVAVAGVVAAGTYSPVGVDAAFTSVQNGAAAFWDVLAGRVPQLVGWLPGRPLTVTEGLVAGTLGLGLAAGVGLALPGRARTAVVGGLAALTLVYAVAEVREVVPDTVAGMNSVVPGGITGGTEQPRDWVDRALPDGASAASVVGRLGVPDESAHWLWTEFWNEDLEAAYSRLPEQELTGWPAQDLDVDEATGRVRTATPPDHLVVSATDPRLKVRGEVVARAGYGAELVRPDRPVRAEWSADALSFGGAPTDVESGVVDLMLYGGRERVRVTLAGEAVPAGSAGRVPYRVAGAGAERRGELGPEDRVSFVVTGRPVPGPGGRRRIRLRLPATLLDPDTRVAAHLVAVAPA
jgi:hypothetical protein